MARKRLHPNAVNDKINLKRSSSDPDRAVVAGGAWTDLTPRQHPRWIKGILNVSKTWVILTVFVADAVIQLIRDGYHLDPVLAGLVAASLGIRAFKEVQGTKPYIEGEQVG